jgi:hypothetical protein
MARLPASSLRSERLRSHMICFVGRAVGLAETSKKKTAPEESGAASAYSDSLFRPFGGFLHKAQIDVVLDVDLLLHESKVVRHIDVAL